jgi:general secretion pathway protein C
MILKLITFFIWLCVSASAVHWGLKAYNTFHAPTQAPVVAATSGQPAKWSAILGEKKAPQEGPKPSISAAQFKLLGLAAATQPGRNQGIALISFQDQPPRSYKVGSAINENLKIVDISNQKVTIGPTHDAKNKNEFIHLEAALLPPAKTSKEPPSNSSNASNLTGNNAPYSGSPTPYPSNQGMPYGRRGPKYDYNGGQPSYGMPPGSISPETGGTQGYPSPPPMGNPPMY